MSLAKTSNVSFEPGDKCELNTEELPGSDMAPEFIPSKESLCTMTLKKNEQLFWAEQAIAMEGEPDEFNIGNGCNSSCPSVKLQNCDLDQRMSPKSESKQSGVQNLWISNHKIHLWVKYPFKMAWKLKRCSLRGFPAEKLTVDKHISLNESFQMQLYRNNYIPCDLLRRSMMCVLFHVDYES